MIKKGKRFLREKNQFFCLEKLKDWLEREDISELKLVP